MSSSVLVTGGAGYVGSHTVRVLLQQGYRVVVLDTLEFGHAEAVGAATLVVGDIADRALVQRLISEHDVAALVHFAAYKAPGESMREPGRYFANNVAGSAALFEASHAAGVRAIVFSSSCAVYGTPADLPVRESDALQPESPYGESKLMAERVLQWYDRCHDVRSVALRYFNAAGAAMDGSLGEDWQWTANLLPLAFRALLGRGSALQVFGDDYPTADGTAIRDYVHVDDLAEAHVLALQHLLADGASDVINLGTGTGTSVREILGLIASAAGRPVPVEYAPRRAGDPVALFADNARAKAVLGWAPRLAVEDIVTSAWRWYRAHPDGY